MKRYIAVDSGKSFTKSAVLNPAFLENSNEVPYFTHAFRTAYEENATFDDDEPGNGTYIVGFEGGVYKVGKCASIEAELDSSKKTLIHKLCTMLAIAKECSENDTDEVVASVGIPVDSYLVVDERNNYRDYILPLGEHTVTYRAASGDIMEKTFKIVQHYVYPETIGAIFTPGIDYSEAVGVLDIGHLNVNMTIYSGGDIDPTSRRTTTKGVNFLVSGLAQELSNELQTTITKRKAAEAISGPRKLKFRNPNPEKEARSAEIIKRYLENYVRDMIEEIRTKNWSLDVMQLVIIGGGVSLIGDDLIEAFGENTAMPENPNMVNAIGFLALMCGRSDTLKIKLIQEPEEDEDNEGNEEEGAA